MRNPEEIIKIIKIIKTHKEVIERSKRDHEEIIKRS